MEHPGNKVLRSMVRAQKPRFLQVKKDEKRAIAFNIVDDIHRLGGRFLTKDHTKHASNMVRHYARRFGFVLIGRRPLTKLCVDYVRMIIA